MWNIHSSRIKVANWSEFSNHAWTRDHLHDPSFGTSFFQDSSSQPPKQNVPTPHKQLRTTYSCMLGKTFFALRIFTRALHPIGAGHPKPFWTPPWHQWARWSKRLQWKPDTCCDNNGLHHHNHNNKKHNNLEEALFFICLLKCWHKELSRLGLHVGSKLKAHNFEWLDV